MLLVHQAGTVKVGEVVRYTLTYTPSNDRILPSPSHIYVKIKNTSAIPLRAAYLRGPYALHVAAYPSTFDPNKKLASPRRDGMPDFEPNLKAAGAWLTKLTVPEDIRESGEKANLKLNIDGSRKTVTWIVEITSQILFSNAASVHYEMLVGRDERSLDLGFAAVAGRGYAEPGQVHDFTQSCDEATRHQAQPRGVYSKAITLVVEDTVALWNKPALPQWEGEPATTAHSKSSRHSQPEGVNRSNGVPTSKRAHTQKKLHLVILTHGLHSNVGADMLYLKESIDNTAKEARLDAKKRRGSLEKRAKESNSVESKLSVPSQNPKFAHNTAAPQSRGQEQIIKNEKDEGPEEEDDEQVVVRGFFGNACRTERGIQYLGKRLAKFVLTTTYPDQPFLPASKSMSRKINATGIFSAQDSHYSTAAHSGSSVHKALRTGEKLPYTFTSISFIGHSLGGLVQTYAIAYIHKHSPGFFKQIKPVNFITMASPLLGLSNENPIYVKFALDFGLVGRTGQDLGLTWRPPALARSGWSAVISGLSAGTKAAKTAKQEDPRSKPLLRILPTGPAHQVLKMFRNRTVYSNAVNDGIVPLRTSCLLFLDWRGLERVENARRENGLIGTMAAFGWAELTGAHASSQRSYRATNEDEELANDVTNTAGPLADASHRGSDVPQPSEDATEQDTQAESSGPQAHQFLNLAHQRSDELSSVASDDTQEASDPSVHEKHPFSELLNLFRPSPSKNTPTNLRTASKKVSKTYRRAQTLKVEQQKNENVDGEMITAGEEASNRPAASRRDSVHEEASGMPLPTTTVFQAAGDILNPPLPTHAWIIDPSSRRRTIFHDRIYHPEDIPPPPPKPRPSIARSISSMVSLQSDAQSTANEHQPQATRDASGMKVEEKIARAYHRDLSWRKVLVRLEPDAHNNMIVRRMFANAYGWDVIKHLCDTHFADTYTATTRDEDETNGDRAAIPTSDGKEDGEQVQGQTDGKLSTNEADSGAHQPDQGSSSAIESKEARDKVSDLEPQHQAISSLSSSSSKPTIPKRPASFDREDSAVWNDAIFEGSEDGNDTEDDASGPFEAFQRFWSPTAKTHQGHLDDLHEKDKSPPVRSSRLGGHD